MYPTSLLNYLSKLWQVPCKKGRSSYLLNSTQGNEHNLRCIEIDITITTLHITVSWQQARVCNILPCQWAKLSLKTYLRCGRVIIKWHIIFVPAHHIAASQPTRLYNKYLTCGLCVVFFRCKHLTTPGKIVHVCNPRNSLSNIAWSSLRTEWMP